MIREAAQRFDADGLSLGKAGPNVGRWVLPGGGVELYEGVHRALQRELKEETGVIIDGIDSEPCYVMEIISGESHRVCLVYRATAVTPRCEDSDELVQVQWFSREQLRLQASIMSGPGSISKPVRDCLTALGALCDHERVKEFAAPGELQFWSRPMLSRCTRCGDVVLA